MNFVIVIVVLFALMWFLLVRPQRKRSEAQLVMQDNLRKDDEIITAGGLHGTVVSIEDDVLEIEIAKDIVVRLDRRAVAAVVKPEEEEPEEEEPEEEEPEALPEKSVSSDDG
jgi:preprotein translocase subunit YajC